MSRILLIIAVLGILAFPLIGDPISHEPGVLAPTPPLQQEVDDGLRFTHKSYHINPLASFEATARVLSRKRYRLGREASLAPVDLALGWGAMSDETILDSFTIWQSNRWYWWRYKTLPIPKKEVIFSSANMHMVPADNYIKNQLLKVKEGHLVRFKGYLIEASADDGWRWRSSLSREDSGDNACELVWVEELEILTDL